NNNCNNLVISNNIEFNLSGININKYKESAEIGINDYTVNINILRKEFRFNENKRKIYIPLEALEIHIVQEKSFIHDVPIRENVSVDMES
ncbi:343_t:CDS:2, partial [Dentiscutata erythropus]